MLNNIIQYTIRAILLFGFSISANAAKPPTELVAIPFKASLKQIYGMVLINHGKGYSLARLDMGLKYGDRILTMDGARAVVVQNDGCVIKLNDNSIFTLKLPSICQGDKKSIRQIGPYYARAIGAEAVTDVNPNLPDEVLDESPLEGVPAETAPVEAAADADVVEPGGEQAVEQDIEVVGAESGGASAFFNSLSTTQIVVTGVAVGLGLAVAGSGGGGGAVSGE